MKKKVLDILVFAVLVLCLIGFSIYSYKIKNKSNNEDSNELAKSTVQNFYKNYYSGEIEKAVELIDFAGMEVYNQQNGDLEDFKAVYDIYIKSEEWKEYESSLKESWKEVIENLNDSIKDTKMPKVELNNFKIEQVSTDVYRVLATIKEIDEDGKTIETGEFEHYIFKNNKGEYKIIYTET